MRSPLKKRFKREIKHHAGRYAAIFLIYVVMVVIISGFLAVSGSVKTTLVEYLENNKVEDGRFSAASPLSEAAINAAEDLELHIYPNFYKDIELNDDQTLRLYENRENVNLPELWEGELPTGEGEIALDRLFAENHHYQVGDTMVYQDQSFKITGLIAVPDYSSMFKNNTDLMMDGINFGIAVTPYDTLEALGSDEFYHNYAWRYEDRDLTDKEKNDLAEEIKTNLAEQQVVLTNFVKAADNQGISFLIDDLGSDVPMMKAFLYIIQIIMAFVFTVIIINTIDEESAVIGTLFASGYRKGELIRHYLTLPILVTLFGALIGNILSYTAGVSLFSQIYYGSYCLPPINIRFNLDGFLETTILPIVVILVINVLMLMWKLSLTPLKFLRHDLKRKKQKRAIRLPQIKFFQRFRLRIILQNKGSYILLFFGMLFASFILTFGICMTPTINRYVDSIQEAAVSEYQYLLKASYELAEDHQAEAFSVFTLETWYKQADKALEVSFYGIAEDSAYWEADVSDLKADEVILSEELCKKLKVSVGDSLTFTNPYEDESYTLTIVNSYSYPAGFAAFMKQPQLNEMMDKEADYFRGYVSDEALNIPEEMVATIITPEDMAKLGEQMMSTFGQMTAICLGAAIVIYLVVIYILTKIVVDKNAQYISFMKVMGYTGKEIKKLYLRATTIAVVGSLLLSLPVIVWVLRIVVELAFVRINGYLVLYLPWYLMAMVAAAGFVVYQLVNWLHIRQIDRIDMALALKDRE